MSSLAYPDDFESQLIKYKKGDSRDYYYIGLNNTNPNYSTKSIVGGEHEIHYLILGFEKDTFVISINSPDGDVGYISSHQDYNVIKLSWDESKQTKTMQVTVVEQHTWISIVFSAHPFASYSIDIEKI
mgnify:CR=1 FL=1|tara:strand:+ start:2693 stop:3076 length:384 start_codon:yes stop_codon:yes gene_type:complete